MSYIGQTVTGARELAEQSGRVLRVAQINDHHQCLDMDLRTNRDNVAVSFPSDPPMKPKPSGLVSINSPEEKMVKEWYEKYIRYVDEVEKNGIVRDILFVG
jgi:hypothetical protein